MISVICVVCCFLFFEPQTTQTDAKIIYDSYCCNLLFLRVLRILWFLFHLISRTSRMISAISVICCFFFSAGKITMFFLPRADMPNLPAPHHVRMAQHLISKFVV